MPSRYYKHAKIQNKATLVAWLLDNATRRDDGCLICHLAPMNTGYPVVRFKGTLHLAHRLVCENTHGPSGLLATHICNERMCIEPGHIKPATHKQNTAHMIRSGNDRFN